MTMDSDDATYPTTNSVTMYGDSDATLATLWYSYPKEPSDCDMLWTI